MCVYMYIYIHKSIYTVAVCEYMYISIYNSQLYQYIIYITTYNNRLHILYILYI